MSGAVETGADVYSGRLGVETLLKLGAVEGGSDTFSGRLSVPAPPPQEENRGGGSGFPIHPRRREPVVLTMRAQESGADTAAFSLDASDDDELVMEAFVLFMNQNKHRDIR